MHAYKHLRWDRGRVFDQIGQQFGGANSERGTRDSNIFICMESVSCYWNINYITDLSGFLITDCRIYCGTSDGGWRCNTSTINLFWKGIFSSLMLCIWVPHFQAGYGDCLAWENILYFHFIFLSVLTKMSLFFHLIFYFQGFIYFFDQFQGFIYEIKKTNLLIKTKHFLISQIK